MQREETMIAVLPSALARVICKRCIVCLDNDERRKEPMKCDRIKKLIKQLKYGKERKRAANADAKSGL